MEIFDELKHVCLLDVASSIRDGAETFGMHRYVRHGRAVCIASHVLEVAGEYEVLRDGVPDVIFDRAAELLGLYCHEADSLFLPVFAWAYWFAKEESKGFIDADRAARQLEYLAENGEVRWTATPVRRIESQGCDAN